MFARNFSAATHAPPSVATRLTIDIISTNDATVLIPTRRFTAPVAVGGDATATAPPTPAGSGSVGGTDATGGSTIGETRLGGTRPESAARGGQIGPTGVVGGVRYSFKAAGSRSERNRSRSVLMAAASA